MNFKNLLGPLFKKLIRPNNGSLKSTLRIFIKTCKSQEKLKSYMDRIKNYPEGLKKKIVIRS